jgi:hypothetical protein
MFSLILQNLDFKKKDINVKGVSRGRDQLDGEGELKESNGGGS